MGGKWLAVAVFAVSLSLRVINAQADVFNLPSGQTSLQFVTVGDPGNQADPLTGYGSVPYVYQMGTYDITVAQYTAMLNAVAATDPYGLYDIEMSPNNGPLSCGIIQAGNTGDYSYSFVSGRGNLPVNNVSFGDALRFANWLANGQPNTGVENASTTENGSYALNGAVTDQQLNTITRSPNATYIVPNENEWYKAAYYKSGSLDAGYWLYPTQNNSPPSNVLSMTGTNNANFDDPVLGLTDPATGLTPVGAFAGSTGPYGTFDMGGNVFQWVQTIAGNEFVTRGGSFANAVSAMQSSTRLSQPPSGFGDDTGFRIAEVPEPNSLLVLGSGSLGLLARRRCK